MNKHEEERRLIEEYRERAQELIIDRQLKEIAINKWGGVQILENGAFVECTMWVPKED